MRFVMRFAMRFVRTLLLLGNLQLLKGPDAINSYAKMLHDLGPLLWVARIGLLAIFGVLTPALKRPPPPRTRRRAARR